MTNKLTLTIDSAVVEKAKQYARKQNVSLSKLVEFYFSSLTTIDKGKNKALSPITASLSGKVKFKGVLKKDILEDSLVKKFL
jgi:hypothetical protein